MVYHGLSTRTGNWATNEFNSTTLGRYIGESNRIVYAVSPSGFHMFKPRLCQISTALKIRRALDEDFYGFLLWHSHLFAGTKIVPASWTAKRPIGSASPFQHSPSFNGLQQMPLSFEKSTCWGPNATTACSSLYKQPRDGRTPRLGRSDAGSAASTDYRLRCGSLHPKYEESSGATIDSGVFSQQHQQGLVNVRSWGFASQVDVMWEIRTFVLCINIIHIYI